MNVVLERFKNDIKGKRVGVIGVGISNRPLIRYLRKLNVEVVAFDRATKDKISDVYREMQELNVEMKLGDAYLEDIEGFDILFKSPGMRFDLPQLQAATSAGTILTSEMEVFMDLCPAPIIAVTGSDGKTTTTTLIYEMLKEEGYYCWLGGNIGTPLLDKIDDILPEHKVILELSSFQLHTMRKSPHIAVITNVSPNHLDMHTDMQEYIDAKKNIYKYQTENDRLILNFDNAITKQMAEEAKGEVVFFSRKMLNTQKIDLLEELESLNSKREVYENDKNRKYSDFMLLDEGIIKYNHIDQKDNVCEKSYFKDEDIKIPGVHNVENYLAAIAAVDEYISVETARKVAGHFGGVEHRIEFVREVEGVKYYNDSIGSSPARTEATVNSFKKSVILIAGGYDKKIPYDAIGELIYNKVKCLILLGQTGDKIKRAYLSYLSQIGVDKNDSSVIPILECNTLQDTVSAAYLNAKSGDVVVLSPASASFDMFKNYEERGKKFKEYVNMLG